MTRIVIVAYRPKPEQEARLAELVARHWQVLVDEGLVTARPPMRMKSADGTLVEVFEWASADAVALAHDLPAVQALWTEFADACEYVPLATLQETTHLFAEFEPLPE